MGRANILATLWLLIAIVGAVFMIAMVIRYRRGGLYGQPRGRRRGPITGAILIALVMFVILSTVFLGRSTVPRMHITVDGDDTGSRVVMPQVPPFAKPVRVERFLHEVRQGLREAELETRHFATVMLEKAQDGIEEAQANLEVENEDGGYLILPPATDKPVLTTRWYQPVTATPAAPVVPIRHQGRARHSRVERGTVLWNLLAGLALVAFLFVGYVFLDAATRGQFTGQLRFLSIVAILVAILASIASA